ncbi:hypothetical protein E2C01_066625 [Portunus trituberculatus]|uniref:Uncharacterized protein n=1 Tax=Portunus trituberculatus TaxID=210409 RepID=A0A5B7HRH0_PORTR|nr:hypothetical protein [Portunus trituberculatus]
MHRDCLTHPPSHPAADAAAASVLSVTPSSSHVLASITWRASEPVPIITWRDLERRKMNPCLTRDEGHYSSRVRGSGQDQWDAQVEGWEGRDEAPDGLRWSREGGKGDPRETEARVT